MNVLWLVLAVPTGFLACVLFAVWVHWNDADDDPDWHWAGDDLPEPDISQPFEVVFIDPDLTAIQADKTARPSEVKAKVRG